MQRIAVEPIESSISVLACNLNLLFLLKFRFGKIFLGIARLLYKNLDSLQQNL